MRGTTVNMVKSVIRYLQQWYNTHLYLQYREPHGPLFTRKWRFAHVWQPNRPEYHLNFTVEKFLNDL